MRIIAKRTLREFWTANPDAERPLQAWYKEVEAEKWTSPHDLKARYPRASVIRDNRAIFRIRQGRFRLVARINYDAGLVYIRFVGTHAQYDEIDAETV